MLTLCLSNCCRSTANCEAVDRTDSDNNNRRNNEDDFLNADISDLPLPDLPTAAAAAKKKKRKSIKKDDEWAQSETLTSTEETFPAVPPTPTPQLSSTSARTPTKVRKAHTRNSSLPRSFRQRNEARAGYLLRRQQRMRTSSAEDLLSFEKRTMNNGGGGGSGGGGSGNRMHFGSQLDKPRYLFGETTTLHSGLGSKAANYSGSRHYLSDDKHSASQDFDNEIFLNKSGWVQVKQRDAGGGGNGGRVAAAASRFDNNNSSSASKLEDLMLRNEARKNVAMQNFYQKGYLPVARNAFGKIESPPPMTPIISPPPAFQDAAASAAAAAAGLSKASMRSGKQQQQIGSRVHLTVSDADYHNLPHHQQQQLRSAISNNGNSSSNGTNNKALSNSNGGSGSNSANNGGKGMVFSRSFEYDNRKINSDYSDVFSKSFEYDLSTSKTAAAAQIPPTPSSASSTPKLQQSASLLQIQRKGMPAFSNLTGNSPNYLTKKEWGPYRQSLLAQQQQQNPPGIPATAPVQVGSTGLLTSRSRDTSPNQAKLSKPQIYSVQSPGGSAARKAYPGRVNSEKLKGEKYQSFDEQVGRSRRAQFSRLRNESSNSSSSRSVDVAAVNRRLNSCDSGARSGKKKKKKKRRESEIELVQWLT